MLCQNCKINESTIHLYTNVNGNKQQIDLCQNCYQIMKTDPNNSLFRGLTQANNQGIDPIDRQLNLEEATVAVAMAAIPTVDLAHANRLHKSPRVS